MITYRQAMQALAAIPLGVDPRADSLRADIACVDYWGQTMTTSEATTLRAILGGTA